MRTLTIHPWGLLKASFRRVQPFYRELLILSVPLSMSPLFEFMVAKALVSVYSILYYVSVSSFFSSVSIVYAYCKITHKELSICRSIQLSIKKFPIILVWRAVSILSFAYLIPRLAIVTWIIMTEDCTLEAAIRRSWNLTRGYGWVILISTTALSFSFGAVRLLSNSLITSLYGASISNELTAILIRVGLNLFLIQPITLVFYTLIFLYVLDAESQY